MNNLCEETIKFYVCVPIYKVEKYLDACIRSVLCQEYHNFCLVLVDDGSPDRCGEICDRYAALDERIEVIHQNNRGLVAARQAALTFARRQDVVQEKYIINLDGDDSLKEGSMQIIYDSIIASGCDLLFYGMDQVRDGNIIHKFDVESNYVGTITDKRKLYNLVLLNPNYNSLCRKAAKLSLYEKKEYDAYYHVNHGEDLLQSIALYKNCTNVLFLEQALYNYTTNPHSITQDKNVSSYTIDSTVRKNVYHFIESEAVFDNEDIANYNAYCKRMLDKMVGNISQMKVAYTQKVKWLQEIRDDEYYSMLLKKAEKRELLLKLVDSGKFRMAIIVGYVSFWRKRCIRVTKRTLRKRK